jgi:hypothetical protein
MHSVSSLLFISLFPFQLNVEVKNVTILEKSLVLKASDGKQKVFSLEVNFLKSVVPETSNWSMASVGRMTFTLSKASPAKWARLMVDKKRPNNMHFWSVHYLAFSYTRCRVAFPWTNDLYSYGHTLNNSQILISTTVFRFAMNEKYEEELEKLGDTVAEEDPKDKDSDEGPMKPATPEAVEGAEESSPPAPVQQKKEETKTKKENPEERSLREQFKKDLEQIEDERRKKKKEIDREAKESKLGIDNEFDKKKGILEETLKVDLASLENKSLL